LPVLALTVPALKYGHCLLDLSVQHFLQFIKIAAVDYENVRYHARYFGVGRFVGADSRTRLSADLIRYDAGSGERSGVVRKITRRGSMMSADRPDEKVG
jgi:hypothetical protein